MFKVKQEMMESQINCQLNLSCYQEDLILKLKMIIKVEIQYQQILINLPNPINRLEFFLKQALIVLMLQKEELLINQYQELEKQQELVTEMMQEQLKASKVMSWLNLLLQKEFLLHFLILALLNEVFLIFSQNLEQPASFSIETAFLKIHLSTAMNHLILSKFFQ